MKAKINIKKESELYYKIMSFNIVELIESNPIARLSDTYQSKLITKIQSDFSSEQQILFVASFYSFLNYDQRKDFVIDLDDVWKWLGFSTKQKAKMLLEQHFTVERDYIKSLNLQVKRSTHVKGGENKAVFMLTVRAFKLFCLKAGTKKAEDIHEYYIKLEELLQEVLNEESNELKLQLENKNIQLQAANNDKDIIREKTILEQFPDNTQCVYYGTIDNTNADNEKLVKFGNSNNLRRRTSQHKDNYSNFKLINAFKVENKLQIENAIKNNAVFKERHRVLQVNDKKSIEILNVNGLTFDELDRIIKDIITGIEYSPENYKKILDENTLLRQKFSDKNIINSADKCIYLTNENEKLKIENIRLMRKCSRLANKNNVEINDIIEPQVSVKDVENYGKIAHLAKRIDKNSEGFYNVDGKSYPKLMGTREEVWEGTAYKTTGGLIKSVLTINKNGKIISMKKSVQETIINRFQSHT
jgi:hypothetical protein